MKIDADGSFSDGLRMNVLPQAIAFAEHPHRDHRREVERRDPGDDAERLADLVDVDAARDLLAEAALQQVRDAGRELEVLEAAGDLAERVRGHLAVLGGQERGDVGPVLVDEVADPEQDLGPLRERRRPPGGERLRRGANGRVDLLGRREVDLAGQRVRSPGRRPGRSGRTSPATDRPPIQWWMRSVAPAPPSERRSAARLCDLRHR